MAHGGATPPQQTVRPGTGAGEGARGRPPTGPGGRGGATPPQQPVRPGTGAGEGDEAGTSGVGRSAGAGTGDGGAQTGVVALLAPHAVLPAGRAGRREDHD